MSLHTHTHTHTDTHTHTHTCTYIYIHTHTIKVCTYNNLNVKSFSFLKCVFVSRCVYYRSVMKYVGISTKQ